jgi:DNA-binding HxlR family transcriptional regulator
MADGIRQDTAVGDDSGIVLPEVELQEVFRLIGKRWNGMIIARLLQRPARFGELSRSIPGLTDGVLNDRLRELMGAGLVERHLAEGPTTAVLYRLTPVGQDFRAAFTELRRWFERNHVVDRNPG